MRLFHGEHPVSFDQKNRLLIPSDIRRAIDPKVDGEAFFMVIGRNRVPWLYTEKYYEAQALKEPSELAPADALLEYDQMSYGTLVRLVWDSQWRILIPEAVLKELRLERAICMVGIRNHVELWNKEPWQKQKEYLAQNRDQIVTRAKAVLANQ